MEGTLEELRRISNCPEGATFSQLGLRKSVDSLQKQEGRQARRRFLLLGGRTEALTRQRAGEGKIICLHNPDSVGRCPSMRKIRQFNHWRGFAVSQRYFRQWVIGCSIIGLIGASRGSGRGSEPCLGSGRV